MNNQHPDTGDIVIGLQPETQGHWLIKEIRHNDDGSITIKFIDCHDDDPLLWSGTTEQYHDCFVYELDYNGK